MLRPQQSCCMTTETRYYRSFNGLVGFLHQWFFTTRSEPVVSKPGWLSEFMLGVQEGFCLVLSPLKPMIGGVVHHEVVIRRHVPNHEFIGVYTGWDVNDRNDMEFDEFIYRPPLGGGRITRRRGG